MGILKEVFDELHNSSDDKNKDMTLEIIKKGEQNNILNGLKISHCKPH